MSIYIIIVCILYSHSGLQTVEEEERKKEKEGGNSEMCFKIRTTFNDSNEMKHQTLNDSRIITDSYLLFLNA